MANTYGFRLSFHRRDERGIWSKEGKAAVFDSLHDAYEYVREEFGDRGYVQIDDDTVWISKSVDSGYQIAEGYWND